MDQAASQEFLRLISQAGPSGSMWEAGKAIGLDRSDTESLATELMSLGHLEVVSLDGKVRLTPSGEELLGAAGPSLSGSGDDLASLVADLLASGAAGLSGAAATDLAADVACLAAQLSRSKPLEAVVQACLKAVSQALANSSQQAARELSARAKEFLS